jgi:ankyrin repeat protein
MIGGFDEVPLHLACKNENMNPEIIQVLLDFWPESIRQQDQSGNRPIHTLCESGNLDDGKATRDILQLLLKMDPQSARETNGDGELPIHYAACYKSLEFCRILLDSFPESVKIEDGCNCLPFHHACTSGSLDTVKHLFTLYPESINVADWRGHLPIHLVARYNGTRKVEIIRFLLAQHPDSASTATTSEDRSLPLHLTCDINFWSHTDLKSTLKVNLGTAKLLFDAYPEAICTNNGDGRSPLEIASVERRHCGNNRRLVKL